LVAAAYHHCPLPSLAKFPVSVALGRIMTNILGRLEPAARYRVSAEAVWM
jgi:hypothetical protein